MYGLFIFLMRTFSHSCDKPMKFITPLHSCSLFEQWYKSPLVFVDDQNLKFITD